VGDRKVNERDWSCNQTPEDISDSSRVRLQVVEPRVGRRSQRYEPNHPEAICRDGSVSFSERRRGTCSHPGPATYRLQFIGPPTEQGGPVLDETAVRAANIEGAIRHAADAEWPPGVHALRLGDLDSQEVYEWLKKRS
jgi:hypothetical protein